MRYRGRITSFNTSRDIGTIRYRIYGSEAYFYVTDVINYDKSKLIIGCEVEFSIRDTLNSNKVWAKDVLLKYKSIRAQNQSKKENLEDKITQASYWEEIERDWEEIDSRYKPVENSDQYTPLDKVDNNSQIKTGDSNYIALALFGSKIKLVTLTKDGEYKFLDEGEKYHNILYPSFIEEAALELAIEEFEDLMNSPKSSENDFQKFFERNSDFILNDDYKKAHPHIILAKEDKKKLIPDFVLEPVNKSDYSDLLEIKLPSVPLYIMKKNREHFSAAIHEAAAQLRTYGDFFNEEKNRNNFQQTYPHLKIYKPRMFLIVGRRCNDNPMIQRKILAEHPHLILRNYDDVLARIKNKKEKVKNKNKLFY